MAIKIERIVEEDLNIGVGIVDVTMPGGGTAVGHKIGHQSFFALTAIATMDGGQPITSGDSPAVLQTDDEETDIADWFDADSTYQFFPDIAGRYQVDGYVHITSFLGTITISVFKNTVEMAAQQLVRTAAGEGKIAVSALVSLDGDADYVTVRVTYSGSGSVTIQKGRTSAFIVGKYDTIGV